MRPSGLIVQEVARQGSGSVVPCLKRTRPSQTLTRTFIDSPSSTSAGSSFWESAPRAKMRVAGSGVVGALAASEC